MSDVAQILGLAGPNAGGSGAAGGAKGAPKTDLEQLKPSGAPSSSSALRGKPPGKQKKLTGMQREVLELLESSHRASHALYQGFSKPSLKQTWQDQRKSPAVKWLRKPFRNPARANLAGEGGDGDDEGLVLSHWVKARAEPSDYVFARFNVQSNVAEYTDAEYEVALAKHHDPMMKWSKEETDVLMKLCRRFDLRWIVIADKYNTNPIAKGAYRSLEDIKYRYYEVVRLLTEYRTKKARAATEKKAETASTDIDVKQEPGTSGPSGSIKVEASTSASPGPQPSPASNDQHYRFNIAYEKQRKRQLELAFARSIEEENEIRRLNEELRGVEQQLKKVATKVDPKKKKELADVPYEIKRTLPTGVILRSSLLALPQQRHALSAKLLKKLQLLLDELGVPARPMPTKPVCETFDKLRQDSVGLLTLRKHLSAKQSEVQLLRDRYHALTGTEFKYVAPPICRSERRGDTAGADGNASSAGSVASQAPSSISKGKTSKHSEKTIRATKRRSSGHPGIPSKRNKKVPH